MKERPILFSAPMVRAILAGQKSQTRRVVKPQPHEDCSPLEVGHYHPTVIDRNGDEQPGAERFGAWTQDGEQGWVCPFVQPGGRLWVRESFQRFTDDGEIIYRADPASLEAMNELKRDGCIEARWRPATYMPRSASRITLEITGIRVERLQDISHADAMAEGMALDDAVYDYSRLWESLHGAGSWAANPWVWVVEFGRVEGGAA